MNNRIGGWKSKLLKISWLNASRRQLYDATLRTSRFAHSIHVFLQPLGKKKCKTHETENLLKIEILLTAKFAQK